MPGDKFDEGKLRMDLVPWEMIIAAANIATEGEKKYGANNFRKGIPYSRIVAPLMRHLAEFMLGYSKDAESGKPHLWHALYNIAMLIVYEFYQDKYKHLNDLYAYRDNEL